MLLTKLEAFRSKLEGELNEWGIVGTRLVRSAGFSGSIPRLQRVHVGLIHLAHLIESCRG